MAEYICREAIIDDLEKEIEAGNVALDEDVWINKGLRIAIRDIKDSKSADVQPVRHGQWIEEVREIGETFRLYQTYIHCSECGKEHYSGTLPKPNFCDECGARMDGEQK